jgi:outer membrane receptor protein involved in Fe transport
VLLRGNAYRMTTDDNLDLDPTFNPAGVQVINFPGREAKGLELELSVRPTTRDFVTASFAQAEAEQLGDCVRREMDGSCTGDANVISRELTDFPRRRFNLAGSVRPLGLWGPRGPVKRALGELALAGVWHHVGPSRNNARVTFEQLNLPFVHPGYDRVDVGLSYPFRAWHGTLLAQVFVQDVLGADLAEPLVLTLEPRPAEGYFLPRPGRSFMLRVEWKQ